MSYLVEFPATSGPPIVVDVQDEDLGVIPAGVDPGQVVRRASITFDQVLQQVRSIAQSAAETMHMSTHSPSEVQINFAVKLSADLGAVLARAGTEATFEMTLKWQQS